MPEDTGAEAVEEVGSTASAERDVPKPPLLTPTSCSVAGGAAVVPTPDTPGATAVLVLAPEPAGIVAAAAPVVTGMVQLVGMK